jgi:hypothetical protein
MSNEAIITFWIVAVCWLISWIAWIRAARRRNQVRYTFRVKSDGQEVEVGLQTRDELQQFVDSEREAGRQ